VAEQSLAVKSSGKGQKAADLGIRSRCLPGWRGLLARGRRRWSNGTMDRARAPREPDRARPGGGSDAIRAPSAAILGLQASAGNRAVGKLLRDPPKDANARANARAPREPDRAAPGEASRGVRAPSAAILRLQARAGGRAIGKLLRDPPKDAKARADAAAMQTAAEILSRLGGGRSGAILKQLGAIARADGVSGADLLQAARTLDTTVAAKWEAQTAAVRTLTDVQLETLDSLAYFIRLGKAKRLFPWVELEIARRSGGWDLHLDAAYSIDDAGFSSFVSGLKQSEIEALDYAAGSGVGRGHSADQYQHLHANIVGSESVDAAYAELRYLKAEELERIEDAGETLDKEQARAVRNRIRRVRDSISVSDVGDIIANQLKYWGDAVCTGVLAVTLEKEDKSTSVDFWTALLGNVFWAAAGFIPEVKGAWMAVKVIGSYAGAVIGSGTAAEVKRHLSTSPADPTTNFRLGITDALTEKYRKLSDDRNLLHMAVDKLWSENLVDRNSDVQRNQRVDTVWKMIFGSLARDESVIRHETADDVGAIWRSFRTIYEDKQDWVTPTMALYRAIIESGKSAKLGVTSVADTKANTVTWSFPGGGKVTLGGRPEDGDYYRYDIPGERKIKKIKPIQIRI
jgi:hypothetical protein